MRNDAYRLHKYYMIMT